MQINVTNLKGGEYSLDLVINKDFEPIRILIPQGETTDIGDLISVDDLNLSEQLIAAVADGDISIATVSEAADISDPDVATNTTDIGINATDILTLQTDLSTIVILPEIKTVQQDTAATAVISAGIAQKAGVVTGVKAYVDVVCASGESYSIDVLLNGTSVLSAPLVVDDGDAIRTAVAGAIDLAADDVAADDVWTVDITYTAGGGPTPATGLCVSIETTVLELVTRPEIKTVQQDTAATAVISAGIANKAGLVTEVSGFVDIVCGTGESFSIDVLINGTTCLTTPLVIDSGDAARDQVVASIDTGADDVAADDVWTVEITYTAGTPTPTSGLCVSIETEPTVP